MRRFQSPKQNRRFSRSVRKNTGCTGKIRYPAEHLAQFEIDRALHLRGDRLRSYACPHCDQWHLTRMGLTQPNGKTPLMRVGGAGA